MTLTTPVAQRDANSARAANQAAENVLCHVAHLNGYQLSDDQFEAFQIAMRDVIAQQLYKIDTHLQLAGGDARWPEPAEPTPHRTPRHIPAVVTKW